MRAVIEHEKNGNYKTHVCFRDKCHKFEASFMTYLKLINVTSKLLY